MRISVISIFPQMFSAINEFGVTGRAIKNGLVTVDIIDLRQFGQGEYKQLDDRPFGGGPGMVMLAEPIIQCVSELKQKFGDGMPVMYLSPQGQRLEQQQINQFSDLSHFILLCGRYEGVDQRALDIICAQEWSIGDYVLSGGELAAMVLIDAVVRQIDGVLGNCESKHNESFANGLLDCVHYTRPRLIRGRSIPDILLSGDHGSIERWRLKQSIGRTWERRPDLLEKIELDEQQKQILKEFQNEQRVMEKP